jgi:arylsulfatase A-like enzyme
MASVLTGLAPTVHLGLRTNDALPAPVRTLASRMQSAGFLTAAFVRNPALRSYTDINRGFDEYHYQREPHEPTALAEVILRVCLPEIYRAQVGAEVQSRRAAAWIAAHKDRDFFLWVHYFDPHMAYNPPRQFQPEGTPPAPIGRNFTDAARVRGGFLNPDADEREWIRQLYAGEVLATDLGLKGLFDELRRQGVYEDALVIFTADHGDELWEHESFEHGHVMYDEVLGVPLFMKLPGGALRERVEVPVSNQSVTPTVLEIAGVPYDPAELSAPPLVRRDPASGALSVDASPRDLVSSGILYFEPRTAIVFEGFKYIQFHVSNREELYDLGVDPGEQHNLNQERADLLSRGRELLALHLEQASNLRLKLGIDSANTRELDDDALRDMRALGYVK